MAMLPAMRRTAAPAIDATVAACCAPATEKAASTCCRPSYIDAARDLYRDAALAPAANLCCTTNPVWQLPELNVPDKMLAMNYGCGTTVHPRDLGGSPSIVYVGVGGGLELLQFAYFSRRRGGVIGLDVVDEMLSACSENLDLAEQINPWFKRSFVDLRKGDAFELPLEDGVIDVAAQNCLFNIFQDDDLGARALGNASRAQAERPGHFVRSHRQHRDPRGIAARRAPACDVSDRRDFTRRLYRAARQCRLRHRRGARPYRVLAPGQFATNRPIVLESVEICAIKSPVAADGPDVFAGHTAIYFGADEYFSEDTGLRLPGNQPTPISAKAAARLVALSRQDIFVSEPTWFYTGAGCC